MIKKIIKDCFTGRDNETYDFMRILIFLGTICYLFLAIYHIIFFANQFDATGFATGFGIIILGGGGGLAFKHTTEPPLNPYEKGEKLKGKGKKNAN